MHGPFCARKANSSELNLFFPLFWLDAGVNAVRRSFLYWDDSSKASPLLAIKLTNKRLRLHYSKPLLKQQSQTPITPLCWSCKSTRTMRRGTITRAGTIIHIKHGPREQWVRHSCEEKYLSSSSYLLCWSSSSLFNVYIFIILFLTHQTQCQSKSTGQTRSFFSGWLPGHGHKVSALKTDLQGAHQTHCKYLIYYTSALNSVTFWTADCCEASRTTVRAACRERK